MTGISEHLHLAILQSDSTGRIHSVNPAAETLLNASYTRLSGQLLADALLLDDSDWSPLLAQSRDKILVLRSCTLHLLKARHSINADLSVQAISDGRHLITIDPMSRTLTIARTEARQQQARHNRHIIKNLAHEIRNPLAGIRGAAQRLLNQAAPGQQPYLDLIIAQVDRLNHLLTTLNGPVQPELAAHNIHHICENALTLFAADPANADIRLIRDYDPGLPAIVVDANHIQQILLNLLGNAAKACDHRGDITIRTAITHQYTLNGHCHRHCLALTVEDQGCGIPEELHIAIFQPMISHFRDGSGLGLAIVQNLVHLHGGAIELDSRPGRTRFTLIFPYRELTP